MFNRYMYGWIGRPFSSHAGNEIVKPTNYNKKKKEDTFNLLQTGKT